MKPSADTANPPTKPLSRAERKALLLAELEHMRCMTEQLQTENTLMEVA